MTLAPITTPSSHACLETLHRLEEAEKDKETALLAIFHGIPPEARTQIHIKASLVIRHSLTCSQLFGDITRWPSTDSESDDEGLDEAKDSKVDLLIQARTTRLLDLTLDVCGPEIKREITFLRCLSAFATQLLSNLGEDRLCTNHPLGHDGFKLPKVYKQLLDWMDPALKTNRLVAECFVEANGAALEFFPEFHYDKELAKRALAAPNNDGAYHWVSKRCRRAYRRETLL